MLRVSPRRDGSMLAASSRRADSLPDARPLGERVARRLAPLREGDVDQSEHLLAELGDRWATGDASYRSMRTSPEYTRGIGQNTVGDTMP